MEVSAKIRYSIGESKVVLRPQGEGVIVEFEKPQRAITKGQSIVFYQGDLVIGGGIIKKVYDNT